MGRRATAMAAAAAAALVAGCGPVGGAARTPAVPAPAAREVALVLYRDGALVRDRRWVDVGAAGATVAIAVPADVEPDDVLVLTGAGARAFEVAPARPGGRARTEATIGGVVLSGAARAASGIWVLDDGKALHLIDPPALSFAGDQAGPAVKVRLAAARPGRYPIDVVYVTPELSWRASYTLIGGAGDRGVLHGAVIVDDRAGLPWPGAALTLVDAAIGHGADAVTEAVAMAARDDAAATPLPDPVDVGDGETSIDLVDGGREVGVRKVLVYDPVGTRFDRDDEMPIETASYGLTAPSSAVAESVELELGPGRAALPAGTVRLVERGADGTLGLRGEGELRASAGAATTIAVGRSPDVSGRRVRTEMSIDAVAKRLVEEFELTLDNRGDHDAQVLVREHLYRGMNWTLPYTSVPAPRKEGPQQIAMRTTVPAHGRAKVVYVVVYSWKPPCPKPTPTSPRSPLPTWSCTTDGE